MRMSPKPSRRSPRPQAPLRSKFPRTLILLIRTGLYYGAKKLDGFFQRHWQPVSLLQTSYGEIVTAVWLEHISLLTEVCSFFRLRPRSCRKTISPQPFDHIIHTLVSTHIPPDGTVIEHKHRNPALFKSAFEIP